MGTQALLPWRLAGIAGTLVLWEIAGRTLGDERLAAPTLVAAAARDLIAHGPLAAELLGSLRQLLAGYGLACLVGMPLGVAMGRSRRCDVVVHPWLSMMVVTSAAALVPLFLVLFGSGLVFRMAIVFMASVWFITLTTYEGAKRIEARYLDVARSFGASPMQNFRYVLLPALYPYLLAGARIGLIHALRAMVMAEMFVLVGYGALIHQTGLDLSTAPLLALLVVLMTVSLGANAVLQHVGRICAPWYEDRRRAR